VDLIVLTTVVGTVVDCFYLLVPAVREHIPWYYGTVPVPGTVGYLPGTHALLEAILVDTYYYSWCTLAALESYTFEASSKYNFPNSTPGTAIIMAGYREKYTPGTIGNLYLLGITLTRDP
jgi:hypothetical protein